MCVCFPFCSSNLCFDYPLSNDRDFWNPAFIYKALIVDTGFKKQKPRKKIKPGVIIRTR